MGAVVGYLSALLGLGGGIIMTTTFSLTGAMTQHEAVATSLLAMVPVGFSATYWHMLAGHVHVNGIGNWDIFSLFDVPDCAIPCPAAGRVDDA